MDYSKESIKEGQVELLVKVNFRYDSKEITLDDAKEGALIEVEKGLLDSDLNYYISNDLLEIMGTSVKNEYEDLKKEIETLKKENLDLRNQIWINEHLRE